MPPEVHPLPDLEARVRAVGAALGSGLAGVLAGLEAGERGPQALAEHLGLDKVLTSRLLKAARQPDAATLLHHVPGPGPLRRFLRAARRREVSSERVDAAESAVADFERLLDHEVGDRSALTSLLAAWSVEARREFELRRKQAAWRATSELRGSTTDLDLSAVFLHPSSDGTRLDVVWVVAMLGLRRLRPGVGVKFSSHRLAPEDAGRRPRDLSGARLEGHDRGRLDAFCTAPPGQYVVQRSGDAVHYTLAGDGYGPESAVDLIFAEVNRAEMARTVAPGSGRRGWAYSDVAVSARRLVFDVLVHEDVYPGAEPELLLYDTAIRGVADVNDRSRDLDRLDLEEELETLGPGIEALELRDSPRYVELVEHVHARLGWDPAAFRAYRVAVEYPLYGMQVAVAFDAPER